MIWHSSEINDVLKEMSVDAEKGLANGVSDIRREQYGKNAISSIEKPSFAKEFLLQLKNKYVYLLFAVAVLSFTVSLLYQKADFWSPLLIVAVVVINALITAFRLHYGNTALDTLKNITNPKATVVRDGVTKIIPSCDLVPGDIILLKEGDYITADARLIETNAFRCNESELTGSNIPADKRANEVVEDITPIAERINMVYSGCSVIHGTAKAVVVETGLNSEIGRTSTLIQQSGADTLPLQSGLDATAKIANIAILVICALIFIIQFLMNFRIPGIHLAEVTVDSLLNSVALAVAAIPEGLPAISTIVIALGIQRIVRDNIIIKKTKALEVLGKTTVICADKTGILTQNRMILTHIFNGNEMCKAESETLSEKSSMVLRLATACSTLDNDSTEKSIESACIEYNGVNREDIEKVYPRLCVIPFDSQRKTMTSINMINGKPIAIVKGAPEIIIEKCSGCDRELILKANDEMAGESLRVVAIAIRQLDEIPANPNPEDIENDLIFVGLLGLDDPPRTEAIEGIAVCDTAGIRTIMITGDNILTAKAVARRIGILKNGTEAITGTQLAELSDTELFENIEKYTVYARVTPEDKLRIIDAWQKHGETVTITGDSIDDSEALTAADIGCVMGKYGADVVKGSADIIIENDSFISIVDAIRESRGLFANIQKSVRYLLSCNIAELLIFIIGLLIFKFPPLAAVQLLWINLLTDSAPAISLSMEKAEADVMKRKPVTLFGRIFDRDSIIGIVIESMLITSITIFAFTVGFNTGSSVTAITMAFLTLGLIQIFHSINVKSHGSVFTADYRSNEFMLYATFLTIFIMFFLALTPAGALFGLEILGVGNFFICLGLSALIIPFCEIYKFVMKRI